MVTLADCGNPCDHSGPATSRVKDLSPVVGSILSLRCSLKSLHMVDDMSSTPVDDDISITASTRFADDDETVLTTASECCQSSSTSLSHHSKDDDDTNTPSSSCGAESPSKHFLEALRRVSSSRRDENRAGAASAPVAVTVPTPPRAPPSSVRPRSAMAALARSAREKKAHQLACTLPAEELRSDCPVNTTGKNNSSADPRGFMDPHIERNHFLRAVELIRSQVTTRNSSCNEVAVDVSTDLSDKHTMCGKLEAMRPQSAAARISMQKKRHAAVNQLPHCADEVEEVVSEGEEVQDVLE